MCSAASEAEEVLSGGGEKRISAQGAMVASHWSAGDDSVKLLFRSRVINEST